MRASPVSLELYSIRDSYPGPVGPGCSCQAKRLPQCVPGGSSVSMSAGLGGWGSPCPVAQLPERAPPEAKTVPEAESPARLCHGLLHGCPPPGSARGPPRQTWQQPSLAPSERLPVDACRKPGMGVTRRQQLPAPQLAGDLARCQHSPATRVSMHPLQACSDYRSQRATHWLGFCTLGLVAPMGCPPSLLRVTSSHCRPVAASAKGAAWTQWIAPAGTAPSSPVC